MGLYSFGFICAALSIVAFLVSFILLRNKSLRLRMWLLLLFTVLALPGFSFAAYYTHLIPESAWYYHFRSLRGIELLIPLIGVAGGVAAALLPRILGILPLLCVGLASLMPFVKPLILPLEANLNSGRWKNGLCLQTTSATCGPASLATILKTFNIEASEAELAREVHTYQNGTEAWYLARAARRRGLSARFNFTENELSDQPKWPAIVGVRIRSVGHFITILDYDAKSDRFLVGDPFRSKNWLTRDQLAKYYSEFTGFYLELSE